MEWRFEPSSRCRLQSGGNPAFRGRVAIFPAGVWLTNEQVREMLSWRREYQ